VANFVAMNLPSITRLISSVDNFGDEPGSRSSTSFTRRWRAPANQATVSEQDAAVDNFRHMADRELA
jgi:hypothetical protein